MKRALLLCVALAFTSACATGRASSQHTLAMAREAFEKGRFAEVAKILDGAGLQRLRSRDLPRAYEVLGQAHERLAQQDMALRTYQTGVALFPKDINLLTHLANLLHRSGLDGEAGPHYQRILKLSPDNAAAHLGLAETERRLGFLDRAAVHYEKTLAAWGDQAAIWRDYGEVLYDARRFDKALEAIEKSLKLAESASARVDQARALWRLGRKPEGFEALARAAALEPNNLALERQRGLWSLETGDLAAAESAALSVLKSAPEDALSLWLKASIALRRGKTDDARPDLERAANQRRDPFVAAAAAGLLKQLR